MEHLAQTEKFHAVLVQAAKKAKKDTANAVSCPLPSLILWLVDSYEGAVKYAVIECYLALQMETAPNRGKGGCPQNTVRASFGGTASPLLGALVNFGTTKEVTDAVAKELSRVNVTEKGLVQKDGEKWPNGTEVVKAAKAARARLAAEVATDAETERLKDLQKKFADMKPLALDGVDTVGKLAKVFEEHYAPMRSAVAEADVLMLELEKAAAGGEIKFSFGGGYQKGPKGKTYTVPTASVKTEA
jgi:hypothetical protein|tara:strand:- start:422 stop:1153 length:732 start_codon:yes stop_codon:yes gene_type:complete